MKRLTNILFLVLSLAIMCCAMFSCNNGTVDANDDGPDVAATREV